MDLTSDLIKQMIFQALKELRTKQNAMIRRLQFDSMLATADWSLVSKAVEIRSPFQSTSDDVPNETPRFVDHVRCDHCHWSVTIPMSKIEFQQNFNDCRIRVLRSVPSTAVAIGLL
jgi:hypothetical protein